jgi:cyclohexanecarboxyl-CoA dehydrogenase
LDFSFSSDQEQFRKAVADFAAGRLAPGAGVRAKSDVFPWDLVREMATLGLLCVMTPEEFGGQAISEHVVLGIVVEELAKADFNLASIPIVTNLVSNLIDAFASDRVKAELLPKVAAGDMLVALGLTEPETGSDAAALKARATRTSNGYVLRGEKTSITALPSASAVVVFASTDPAARAKGVSAFVVPLDLPGISVQRFDDTGYRCIGRGALTLDDVEIPHDALLGQEGQAFTNIMNGFDYTRPLLALTAIASARVALQETAEYAGVRTSFGRPLANYQGVAFKLAEHWTELELARLLCYRTLWLRDQNSPHTVEAAMCKWFAPERAFRAVHDCLLVHGHVGYSTESPFEQRLRDVLAMEIADGTAQIQKLVIARGVFGREFGTLSSSEPTC